jgi:2-oxoglutarate ferredoxin oxidoreductase subunit beta
MSTPIPTLTTKDLTSDQEVRWCPACGDFAILAVLKKVLASLGIPREQIVFVSGIGCASRLPYYLQTYGFHTISGKAPAIATGLKVARPDLSVWVITGDSDGLGAGVHHLTHALRRNVDLKILLFNNETAGLSKGQFSPTTRLGTLSRSSPYGSFETPLRPAPFALAAGATFVARTIDTDGAHLETVLQRAAEHRGSAFVEILQNCKIFNDGVFDYATDRSTKADAVLLLEHGRPLVFGKDRHRSLRLRGLDVEIVESNGQQPNDALVHDERAKHPLLAQLLASLSGPEFPECFGVFRCATAPSFEELIAPQTTRARSDSTLADLFRSDDMWYVRDTD